MEKAFQALLIYFNFFGVSNYSFNKSKKKFHRSKLIFYKNLILIPAAFILLRQTYSNEFILAAFRDDVEIYSIKLSKFFKIFWKWKIWIHLCSAVFCVYGQSLNSNKIEKFLNYFLKSQSVHQNLIKHLSCKQFKFRIFTFLVVIFSFCYDYHKHFKYTWQGVSFFVLSRFYRFIALSFIFFFEIIFYVFQNNVEKFHENLKKNCGNNQKYSLKLPKLLKQFYDIKKLFLEFHEALNFTLTIVCSLCVVDCVCTVSSVP